MTTIITGAFGFTGKYLVKAIQCKAISVSRPHKEKIEPHNDVIMCDLLDTLSVNSLIKKYQPKCIYHLAGSYTQNYDKDYDSNVVTTKNILNAVKEFSPKSRILLIGSAAEYGTLKNKDCPVNEESELKPFNVYGLTKIYQKSLMDYYINQFSLNILMARPFNLFGRNAPDSLFIGSLYKQIDLFKSGKIHKISLGNLESKRDYICVKDAVKHYIKIMEVGKSGQVYNVGTGKPTLTKDFLKIILDEEGLDLSCIKPNDRPIKANDSSVVYADISKLQKLYN